MLPTDVLPEGTDGIELRARQTPRPESGASQGSAREHHSANYKRMSINTMSVNLAATFRIPQPGELVNSGGRGTC